MVWFMPSMRWKSLRPVCSLGRFRNKTYSCLLSSYTHTSPKISRPNEISLRNASGKQTISFLEELFPGDKGSAKSNDAVRRERHVPRRTIDTGVLFKDTGLNYMHDRPKRVKKRYLTDNEAILVLRNGGRHLTEDDFWRMLPSGDHIEGWRRDNDITKVLPERDLETMQMTGVYFILFPSLMSAETYRKHVARVHHFARSYNLDSLTAPIPPAPSLNGTGHNLYSLLKSYSLVPSSQPLHLRVTQFPFHPIVRSLMENDGYEVIVKGRRSNHEVMISPESFHTSILSMRQALSRDCRERALKWATVGPDSGIRMLDLHEHSDNSSKKEMVFMDSMNRPRRTLPTFVVSLADNAEAKRFVATWHRRDIASLLESSPGEEHRSLVVNAELLW